MISPIRPTCATCRFFLRFTEESAAEYERRPQALLDDSEAAFAVPIIATEPDSDLLDYGKCIRNPPQFLAETLNGDWPAVHESCVCGEYRPTGQA